MGGGGTYSGDGGPATNAGLNFPIGVTVDACGRLFIADWINSRIRKVETNGTITTVAGTNFAGYPSAGYSGDSGAAVNAKLAYPEAVALDAVGNLYIADSGNNRIRKVDTNGIITTVAGTNTAGYSGDGIAAINASLGQPVGLALDAVGNLYIADCTNNRIRKVDTNGIITTMAGTGSAGYSGDGGPAANARLGGPVQVVLDALGALYITDANNRVRKVDINGFISTVAGNGPSYPAPGSYSGDGGAATNAGLFGPWGLAFDAVGNLYIGDGSNQRIRKVLLSAGYPTLTLSNVLAGSAGSYSVVVSSPYGSVTSAVAALTVTIPTTAPQIMTGDGFCGFLTNQFGFNLSGAFGQTIVVDGSIDLVNWTPLFTNTVGSGNPFYFCDPCWTNYGWRFYRARLP
jgi:sugar lactone lactonase YvrE